MRPAGRQAMFILSHVGYGPAGPKAAILATPEPAEVSAMHAVTADGLELSLPDGGSPVRVPGWQTAWYRRIDLERLTEPGTYRLSCEVDGRRTVSDPFEVAAHRVQRTTVSDITSYFRSVRSTGRIERKDAHARFYGDDSGREVDARGGWLDASGDYSKFLSHLTYTRMMSPQQIPLCAWAMFTAAEALSSTHADLDTSQPTRLRDEGLHGADFLIRFRDPAGYFYTGIFDALTKKLEERVITAPLQDSVRTQRWQAAYRHGGGMAIAALAVAATQSDHGEYTSDEYMSAAVAGFEHLEHHNTEYLFDGQESAIDDYCALMAASELIAAARARGCDTDAYERAAGRRATSLVDRYRTDENGVGYLLGDVTGRPYFHAAESGLPVIALFRYAETTRDADAAATARRVGLDLLQATVARIDAVPNPFGYLRQRVQPTDQEPRDSFFYPHENETGYWWQGENANIASVAYAATRAADMDECPSQLRSRLQRLATDLVHWVVGLNPFDSCMLQGRGHGTPEYISDYQNTPGGIVNGITGGFTDESDIALMPDDATRRDQWRWVEQWIPHTGWFVLAVCALP